MFDDNDGPDFPELKNSDAAFHPFEVDETKEKIIWGYYDQMTTHQHDLKSSQVYFRHKTSSWMLLALAAIGILLIFHHANIPIFLNHFLAIEIFSIAVVFIIFMIWQIDMLMYHSLWGVTIKKLAWLERKFDFLPKVNVSLLYLVRMNRETKWWREFLFVHKKFNFHESTFYVGSITIFTYIFLFIFACEHLNFLKASCAFKWTNGTHWYVEFILILIVIFVLLFIPVLIRGLLLIRARRSSRRPRGWFYRFYRKNFIRPFPKV